MVELGCLEKNRIKRQKLDALRLDAAEWERARTFLGILEVCHQKVLRSETKLICLKVARQAQHSFSSESVPTLHHAVPALHAVRKVWVSRSEKAKYAPFAQALKNGVAKIEKYHHILLMHHACILATGTSY